MDTELRTERLTLRRWRPSDLQDLQAVVSDYDVVKMTASWPWPINNDLCESRCTPFPPEKGLIGPVIWDGKVIGSMGISNGETGPNLGYMFSRAYWGQGFATEMGRAMIDHVFKTYPWTKIYASTITDNPASGRVLKKLGFVKTGTSTGKCVARRADQAMIDYALLRPKA